MKRKLELEGAGPSDVSSVESLQESMPDRDIAKHRFSINVATNLASAVLSTLLMLWYVPFLVRNLGVAAYGMIALATSLVLYASVVSNSLQVSINRFLAIDLNQGRDADANRTFNTSLAIGFAACVLLLVPAAIVTYLYPTLFEVPAGTERETQFLFASVFITFLLAILSGNFGVSSIIRHRFDLRNVVALAVQLSRIGIVVICFNFWSASLWWVAVGFIVSALIGLLGDILVWRSLTPQLNLNYRDIDRRRVHSLINFSGWVSVNQFGNLLLMQVSLLVVNAFFGAEMTGRFASIMLFATLILTITDTFASVLSPAILARYALHDFEGLRRIALRSVKLLGIGLALPVGLLCGLGQPLLSLWLGPEFADLELILVLLIGQLSVNSAARPLAYVLTAYSRVKLQAIFTIVLGVGNLIIAVAVAEWGGWGMAGVAAAGAFVWTIRNAIFLASYSAGVMGVKVWTCFAPLISGALGTLGVALIGKLVTQHWWPVSWFELGTIALFIAIAYGIAANFFFITREDRHLLLSFAGKKLQN